MRLLIAALVASTSAPALAQHAGHGEVAKPAAPTCTPEHAAMGHCKLTEPGPAAPAPPPAPAKQSDPHAGHAQEAIQPTPPRPASSSCTPEHAAMGHCTPPPAAADPDPHAGHEMGSAAEPPKSAPPAAALSGPEHAADQVYDQAAMERARDILRREHGALPAYRLFVERAETRIHEGRDGYLLDAQGWIGGDIDKAWFKGEVEGGWGRKPEHSEVQALWSRAVNPWFDLQTGVRYDPLPGPDRAHLVLGIQGLAPYWFEVDGALFLSNKGELTARAEGEYDLRITQKLIFQPRAELDFSFQDIKELGLGSGLSQAALGARLRYQLSQLFAPYVGVEYERAFGRTARYRRDEGERAGSWNLLAGLRFWF